jgi:UDP-N-acetylenolpyruvoylglucosamine reductase
MLSDSQIIKIATVDHTLARVPENSQESGSFAEADANIRFSVSHSAGKQTRTAIRLATSKTVPDLLLTGVSNVVQAQVYIVGAFPKQGYTVAQKKELFDAVTDWLKASSGANLTKVLGGEA